MPMTFDNAGFIAIALLLAVAVCFDLKFRIIPNWLCGCIIALGLSFQFASNGLAGLGMALAGMALALAIFIPLYAMGWMGAGDAKLIAALGTFFGPLGTANLILFTLIAGGVMALVHIVGRRSVVVAPWLIRFYAPDPRSTKVFFPYALAIAAGGICANFFTLVNF